MTLTPVGLAIEMASVLEAVDIPYAIGGSVASSFLGEPRTTVDIDMAVRLAEGRLALLLAAVHHAFYVPAEAARVALVEASSFNLIHHASGLKVDLFVLGDGLLDRRQIERRVMMTVRRDPLAQLWMTSAEDLILRKLEWFSSGGGVSDRQWRDVIGMLANQADYLDRAYLVSTAEAVGLADLLDAAISNQR